MSKVPPYTIIVYYSCILVVYSLYSWLFSLFCISPTFSIHLLAVGNSSHSAPTTTGCSRCKVHNHLTNEILRARPYSTRKRTYVYTSVQQDTENASILLSLESQTFQASKEAIQTVALKLRGAHFKYLNESTCGILQVLFCSLAMALSRPTLDSNWVARTSTRLELSVFPRC